MKTNNRTVLLNLEQYESDALRRRVVETDGRGNSAATEYDDFGRVVSRTDAAGAVTRFVYDAIGRVAAVTNALGVATVYEYDARGNKIYEGGATYPVRFQYDIMNVMTNMTTYREERSAAGAGADAGDTTSWVYDEASGALLRKVYADGAGPSYAYDANGRLVKRIWARGVETLYSYDGWGNLTNVVYSDGTPSVAIEYDAMGREKSVADAKGVTAFAYDDFGALASETMTGLYSKTILHHRDTFGRDVGFTLDNSRKNIIEYSADTGRILRMKAGGAWFTWEYLAGTDLKSKLTYGTSGNTTWEYETQRDLLTRVRNFINGGVISQYDYANDAAGRRTEMTRSGSMMVATGADAYGYNDRDELVSAASGATAQYAYQYDDIGNRVTSSDLGTNRIYSANELNQYTNILCNASPTLFMPAYDLDGNQTNILTSTGIWSVTYNGENRPVNWQCGATNITMKYDHMGRRVEYLETVGGATNRHERFVYNGYLCVQELNSANANAVAAQFIWDPTEKVATRPLFTQNLRNGIRNMFYTFDGNKNVSELVHFEQRNGIAAHYEYAPFGAVTHTKTTSAFTTRDFISENPFRFSSEFHDDILGLVYYNYRHYNPIDGRWLNRDSIEESGGVNLYCFLFNNPIINTDSYGNLKSFAHYKFDRKRCKLEVSMTWLVVFSDEDGAWSKTEKSQWMSEAKNVVEGYFNSVPFKCETPSEKCFCERGISVSFKLNFMSLSFWDRLFNREYDIKVQVSKDNSRSKVVTIRDLAYLDKDDVETSGKKQVTIVHEAGHMLGLEHPGRYKNGIGRNSKQDYLAEYRGLPGDCNLMGEGMALHKDDFDRAFCKHIQWDDN